MADTMIFLTGKSLQTIYKDGGSGYFKVNRDRANDARWLLLCHHNTSPVSEHITTHGRAWLLAEIERIDEAYEGRSIVRFDRYAEIDIPDLWDGSRNPVRYANLDELDINQAALDWKLLSETGLNEEWDAEVAVAGAETASFLRNVVDRAKADIASATGLTLDEIAISISPRGAS